MRLTPELLVAMGFERGTGWSCETYVYQGNIWVFFNDNKEQYVKRGKSGIGRHNLPQVRAEEMDLKELVALMCDVYERKPD